MWIDVNERLPKIESLGSSKVVWCLDSLDRVGFGMYMDGSQQLQGAGWFTAGSVGEQNRTITHWMPIPRKEKDKTNDKTSAKEESNTFKNKS